MNNEITKKAIIVEDNLILSVLYQNILQKKVFKTVGEIRDGETAVGLVKKYNPDIVIMDIMLEGEIDGIDAAERIRKFSMEPILFITGSSDKPYVFRASNISNSEFILKPISQAKLSEAVDTILARVV